MQAYDRSDEQVAQFLVVLNHFGVAISHYFTLCKEMGAGLKGVVSQTVKKKHLYMHNGCPQKKCLEAIFSIIETTYNGYFL